MINKKNFINLNEIKHIKKVSKLQTLKNKIKTFLFQVLLLTLISTVLYQAYIIKKSENYTIITDSYVDCVNIGKCEDLTNTTVSKNTVEIKEKKEINNKQINNGNNKLGEVITHKGVYINSGIINAIDNKFTKDEAEKLKTIMLAECAKDYKIDGIATYECRSNVEFYNKWNNTWDCGYLQINQKGKCSTKSFEINYQIEMAFNKIYSIKNEGCGGFNCWSSYKFRNSKQIHTDFNRWNNK